MADPRGEGQGGPAVEQWWAQTGEEVAEVLGTDPRRGLDTRQVDEMRARYGRSEIPGTEPTGFRELLWESLTSPMMLLLLAVAGISLALGQWREAAVMAFVVLTYVGVELINKGRTDRTLARLRQLQKPEALVIRAGERLEIAIDELVVGDLIPLAPGTRIAGDGRLLSSAGLLINEAPLTGESAPQAKDAGAVAAPEAPLAERPGAVYAGTTVLDGEGMALVVALGADTALGQVAELAAGAAEQRTPLQQEMADLARTLAYVALVVSLLIPAIGWLRGLDLEEMVLTWLSLTFLMVPGQPPIIITMALALAAFELARSGIIARRLAGAETLGSVTALLSDKTGTLTENRMVLEGVLTGDGALAPADDDAAMAAFLHGALPSIPEHSKEPTDRALTEASRALESADGVGGETGTLVDEIGFSRGGAFRAMVYASEGGRRRFLTGRPAYLIERADRWLDGGEARPWDDGARAALLERVEALAQEGKRITAYALDGSDTAAATPEALTFVGCAVIADPVRAGAGETLGTLARAGVRTVMVTGDIPATARYVAEEVGLDAGAIMTGSEIEEMDSEALERAVRSSAVFARTTPEHKLRLVEAMQRQAETVAVTGDGVNDAPALRSAHLGIAMGERGTDVARDAADLILTDDDLTHLIEGVAIGRKAYDNFRKGITYYLSAKAILLTSFIIPLAIGVPFPFAPIQIIATELLMDLASSTIFITEAAEPNVLERKPRRGARFLSRTVGLQILRNSVGLVVAILAVYLGSLAMGASTASARTAAWATWLLGHICLALNLKQERVPLLRQGLLSNRFAAGWLAGMVVLVLGMTFVPAVQAVLETSSLTLAQWVAVIAGAVLSSAWIEARKWVVR